MDDDNRQIKYNLSQFQISATALETSQVTLVGRFDKIVPTCNPKWALVNRLIVNIELDEMGDYIISDDQFLVYGVGKTRAEAIEDYLESLIEYYRLVESADDNPHDKAELQRLKIYLSDETHKQEVKSNGAEKTDTGKV